MDVVEDRIAVLDHEWLPFGEHHDLRSEAALLLVQQHAIVRDAPTLARLDPFEVDDDVLKRTVRDLDLPNQPIALPAHLGILRDGNCLSRRRFPDESHNPVNHSSIPNPLELLIRRYLLSSREGANRHDQCQTTSLEADARGEPRRKCPAENLAAHQNPPASVRPLRPASLCGDLSRTSEIQET
jgi:hypothetical protein